MEESSVKLKIFQKVPEEGIPFALWRLQGVIDRFNFLFVILDSSDPHGFCGLKEEMTDKDLGKIDPQQYYESHPEGLWFRGRIVRRIVDNRGFSPNFNACYIFPSSISRCSVPPYTYTSEGPEFEYDAISIQLTTFMEQSNACGYLADGVGLDILLVDKDLIDAWNAN